LADSTFVKSPKASQLLPLLNTHQYSRMLFISIVFLFSFGFIYFSLLSVNLHLDNSLLSQMLDCFFHSIIICPSLHLSKENLHFDPSFSSIPFPPFTATLPTKAASNMISKVDFSFVFLAFLKE